MYNFDTKGIPNHPDYLRLSEFKPALMDKCDCEVAKYVYPNEPYAEEVINQQSHDFITSGDIIYIDGKYKLDTFEIGDDLPEISGYNLYWFGNCLLFYKKKEFKFALNQLESLKLLSYNSMKVSTYQLLIDHINIKDHYDHAKVYGCVAMDFIGPWTPYWVYTDHGYYATVAQNVIIESTGGSINYNERYGKNNA